MATFSVVTATWPSGSPTSAPLPMPISEIKGMTITISGAWTNSQIGVQAAVIPTLFLPYYDWQGGLTGVSIPSAVANSILEAPPSWYFLPGADNSVKLWSHDGTGSGVPQAAARTVIVAGVWK